jgi:hypothetical protein
VRLVVTLVTVTVGPPVGKIVIVLVSVSVVRWPLTDVTTVDTTALKLGDPET